MSGSASSITRTAGSARSATTIISFESILSSVLVLDRIFSFYFFLFNRYTFAFPLLIMFGSCIILNRQINFSKDLGPFKFICLNIFYNRRRFIHRLFSNQFLFYFRHRCFFHYFLFLSFLFCRFLFFFRFVFLFFL